MSEGQARQTTKVPTLTKPTGDQGQSVFATERVMHRCSSDSTLSVAGVKTQDKIPDIPLTANSLPRNATVSMETEKLHHKEWHPQDFEDLNPEFQKRSECLSKPNSIANLLQGAMPLGTLMNVSEGQSHQKRKVLTPVSRPRQIPALCSTCHPHMLDDANKPTLPDLETALDRNKRDSEDLMDKQTQLLNFNTNDKLNEDVSIRTDCHDIRSTVLNATTQEEKSRTPSRNTSGEMKRTRGSISKLVVKPKPFDVHVDIDERRLQEQGFKILHSYEDQRNTEQQVMTKSGDNTRQCSLTTISYNSDEGQNGCESASLQSDNSSDSGVYTTSSATTSSLQ